MINERNTVQRSLVLDAVKELRCHATADEVYNIIVKIHPDISRGTVYRNLNLLSGIGEIRKLEMHGADRYDHLCHDHYHARCIKCSRIIDVEMPLILDSCRITDTLGFNFTGHDITFKGISRECNE